MNVGGYPSVCLRPSPFWSNAMTASSLCDSAAAPGYFEWWVDDGNLLARTLQPNARCVPASCSFCKDWSKK